MTVLKSLVHFSHHRMTEISGKNEKVIMGTNVKISEQQNPKCEQKVVSRDERVAARFRLLNEEKELTRRSDELARRRQELPWVRIDASHARFSRIQRHFYPWSGQLIFRSDLMADCLCFGADIEPVAYLQSCLRRGVARVRRMHQHGRATTRLQNRSHRDVSGRVRREVLPIIRVRRRR
jgi:hypothetical protein